jgi:TolA-binding protein
MIYMRYTFLLFCYFWLSTVSFSQDRTLSDIRAELPTLFGEIKSLELELRTSKIESLIIKGEHLDRINSIEKELISIISQVENLQYRIERIVRDGTNHISDIRFRLCDIEFDCNIENFSQGNTLGKPEVRLKETSINPEIFKGVTALERNELYLIETLLRAGNSTGVVEQLEVFLDTYTNGTIRMEIMFLLGKALMVKEQWSKAAKTYLDIYSSFSKVPRTGEALYFLSVSFVELNQFERACLMLTELRIEYPDSDFADDASQKAMELNCQ